MQRPVISEWFRKNIMHRPTAQIFEENTVYCLNMRQYHFTPSAQCYVQSVMSFLERYSKDDDLMIVCGIFTYRDDGLLLLYHSYESKTLRSLLILEVQLFNVIR